MGSEKPELSTSDFRRLNGSTRDLLAFAILDLIEIIRLFDLQRIVLDGCAGKPIRDDLLYRGLLFSSMDGLIVRLCNLGAWVIGFLGSVSAGRLNDFPRALGKQRPRGGVMFLGDP